MGFRVDVDLLGDLHRFEAGGLLPGLDCIHGRTEVDALEQVHHVFIEHADATVRHRRADRAARRRAMDA